MKKNYQKSKATKTEKNNLKLKKNLKNEKISKSFNNEKKLS